MPLFEAALGLDEAAAERVFAGLRPLPGQLCIRTGSEKVLQQALEDIFGSLGSSLVAIRNVF